MMLRHRLGLAALLALAPCVSAGSPAAEWPEELGRPRVAVPGRPVDTEHEGYVRALARLEPGPAYDPRVARQALSVVAAGGGPAGAQARYALAWLDEQEGADARAEGGYLRLILDELRVEASDRARVGYARLLLRAGQCGSAAGWLQEAIDGTAGIGSFAAPLRELAVRGILRGRDGRAIPGAVRRPTALHDVVGFVAGASGGAFLADAKGGRVVRLDAVGRQVASWSLPDVEALTADATGRVFAASAGSLLRLDEGGLTTRISSTGDYSPLAGLAADGLGRVWLLDRKGRRVGCVSPGQAEPQPCWESDGPRLADLAWDGRRLVGADLRSRSVVVVDRAAQVLLSVPGFRPSALAVDAAGRLAVLDAHQGLVKFLRPDGRPDGEVRAGPEVASELQRIALGPDGALHAFDAGDGAWVTWP